MEIILNIFLFLFGACIGSFLCCQVRRLRLKEEKKKSPGSRSVCLSCGYKLKWYDNLPIISWLILGGKCRKCRKKIGLAELLTEIGTGAAFLLITLAFNRSLYGSPSTIFGEFPGNLTPPYPIGVLNLSFYVIMLIFILVLIFLAIYDGLYGELPTSCLVLSLIFAVIILVIKEYQLLTVSPFVPENILAPLISVLILGGLYLILYLISKGRWVGDGDWILGTSLGLVLFAPLLSLLTLFLSNFIALAVMLPFLKGKHKQKIYFGPFLVIAFIIVCSFCDIISLW